MNSSELQKRELYTRNVIKKIKSYLENTTPDILEREFEFKIDIGAGISISRNKKANYYYIFYYGNQLFNLESKCIKLSGISGFNYIELQEKDMYFNAMISGEVNIFSIIDFKNMQYVYSKLREVL